MPAPPPSSRGRRMIAAMTISPINPPPPALPPGIGMLPPSPGIDVRPPPCPRRSWMRLSSVLRIFVMTPPNLSRTVRLRSRDQPLMPTAPAPINGARSPSRVGVILACRLYGRRAHVLSSSWAALKNVAAKPRATPPPTTTRSRSRRLQSDAAARPTRRPVRCMISYVGSVGDRPVIASIANPDASASRQPRAPHVHRRPLGSTITWPMCPALVDAPSSNSPSRTMPPPMLVDTVITQ